MQKEPNALNENRKEQADKTGAGSQQDSGSKTELATPVDRSGVVLDILKRGVSEGENPDTKLSKTQKYTLDKLGLDIDESTTIGEAIEKMEKGAGVRDDKREKLIGLINEKSARASVAPLEHMDVQDVEALEAQVVFLDKKIEEKEKEYRKNNVKDLIKSGVYDSNVEDEYVGDEQLLNQTELVKSENVVEKQEQEGVRVLDNPEFENLSLVQMHNQISELLDKRGEFGKLDVKEQSRLTQLQEAAAEKAAAEEMKRMEKLKALEEENLKEAEALGERGWVEKLGDDYNNMHPLKKIGIAVALVGVGGAGIVSGGLPGLAGLALITASRGIGGIGKFAKYKKMLESEDGRGELNEQAGRLQKFFGKIDGFVVGGMQKNEWVKKNPRWAASFVGLAHFGIFTGGFVNIAEYLKGTEWVKDVFDKADFPDLKDVLEPNKGGVVESVSKVDEVKEFNGLASDVPPAEIPPVEETAVAETGVGKFFELSVHASDKGAIPTFADLKEQLRLSDFPDGQPDIVKKILHTDAVELAKEYGFYRPGLELESAMLVDGDSFNIENGNLVYETAGGEKTILESGGLEGDKITEKMSEYKGEMFDANPSPEDVLSEGEVSADNVSGADTANLEGMITNQEIVAQIEEATARTMAKDINALYEHGAHSEAWVGVKGQLVKDVLSQEYVGEGESALRGTQQYLNEIINQAHIKPDNTETVEEFIKRAHRVSAIDNIESDPTFLKGGPAQFQNLETEVNQEVTPAQEAQMQKLISERALEDKKTILDSVYGNENTSFVGTMKNTLGVGNPSGIDSDSWNDVKNLRAADVLKNSAAAGTENVVASAKMGSVLQNLITETSIAVPETNESVDSFLSRLIEARTEHNFYETIAKTKEGYAELDKLEKGI